VSLLTEKNQQSAEENSTYEHTIKSLTITNKTLENSLSNQNLSISQLNGTIDVLKQEIQQLKETNLNQFEMYSELLKNNEKFLQKLKSLNQKKFTLTEEISKQEQNIQSLKSTNQALENEKNSQNALILQFKIGTIF
jgi:chromosome segregation ATPase